MATSAGVLQDSSLVPPNFLFDVLALSRDGIASFYTGNDREAKTPVSPDPTRPYVTLTFAQSLDAKIAGARGKQLALSGKESMVMTHWMRTMHDAILIGVGTALNDDPQLNTRHLPPLPEGSPFRYRLPRPVILDTNLRLSPNCKLLKNFREGRGRRPWIVTSHIDTRNGRADAFLTVLDRREALEAAGAEMVEVAAEDGMISIPDMLGTLRQRGIRSVMVEGGASVIESFLAARIPARSEPSRDAPKEVSAGVVDTVIVTVAPVLVGQDGVSYGSDLSAAKLPALQHVRTELFGHDAIMALKVSTA